MAVADNPAMPPSVPRSLHWLSFEASDGDDGIATFDAEAAVRAGAPDLAALDAEVAAVLAWLPRALPADLRRLQVSAQRHRRLLFVLRPDAVRTQASPACLRLWLAPEDAPEVHVLKRRGPPLAAPVYLPQQPALLADVLRARAQPGAALHSWAPLAGPPAPALRPALSSGRPHGLDRTATPS